MGGVGQLVGVGRKVGRVMFGGVLVQLEGRVAIFGSVGCVGHGFSLDPHHDGLSLKHPHFFSQIPVGLHISSAPLRFGRLLSCFSTCNLDCLTCCASASDLKVMNQLSLPANSQLRNVGRPSPLKSASTSCTRTEEDKRSHLGPERCRTKT